MNDCKVCMVTFIKDIQESFTRSFNKIYKNHLIQNYIVCFKLISKHFNAP